VEVVEDPQITSARIHDIRLITARELAPHRLLLDLELIADLELDLAVSTDEAEELENWPSIYVIGNSNNDYFIDASTEIAATIRAEATTNLDATIVEVAIQSIRQ